jgi:hypothetical protein
MSSHLCAQIRKNEAEDHRMRHSQAGQIAAKGAADLVAADGFANMADL